MFCYFSFFYFFIHPLKRIIAHHQQQERPNSAPVVNRTPSQRNAHRPRQSLPSEQSSLASSRNSSPVSMVSSTGSSSIPDVINTIHDIHPRFTTAGASTNNSEDDERDHNDSSSESKSTWPYLISRPITCLFCTLGLFNISRFAIFSVHFGGKHCYALLNHIKKYRENTNFLSILQPIFSFNFCCCHSFLAYHFYGCKSC